MNDKRTWIVPFTLGITSGVLVFIAFYILFISEPSFGSGEDFPVNLLSYDWRILVPGAVFGLVSVIYFLSHTRERVKLLYKIPVWILASSLSFVTAREAFVRILPLDVYLGNLAPYVAWGSAGLVGAFILVLFLHLFFVKLRWKDWILWLGIGFAIPAFLNLFWEDVDSESYWAVLFVVWQTSALWMMHKGIDFKSRINQKWR